MFRIFFLIALLCTSCKSMQQITQAIPDKKVNILDSLLTSDSSISDIIKNKDSFHVQIIYTQINRNENNIPSFTNYTYNLNHNTYFYPASTVKMPAAFLALQKINELQKPELLNATMITDSSFSGQDYYYNDYKTTDGKASISNYIKEIFWVSDNNAFKRLYEFLGQEYINDALKNKGYKDATIRHRLSRIMTDEESRNTNKISFYNDSIKIYEQAAQRSSFVFKEQNIQLGKGYYSGGKLINKPFNFSTKNKVYLDDLHKMLQSFIFPEQMNKSSFNITEEQRKLVLSEMCKYPNETLFPVYQTPQYDNGYVKFLLQGGEKNPLPDYIKIFSKSGLAYGFLTDITYIIDTKNKTEFMLSATILCNSDGIFNDDKYDYNKVGLPFMKKLGMLIYNYELKRPRKHLPDLTEFSFSTEKPN